MPTFYHVLLRNGQKAIARELQGNEALPPWRLTGFRMFPERTFPMGDPELWRGTGHWLEAGKVHGFDIVLAQGIVNFSQPGPELSNQEKIPEQIVKEVFEHLIKHYGPQQA